MRTGLRSIRRAAALGFVGALVAVLLPVAAAPSAVAAEQFGTATPGSVVVLSANLREGSFPHRVVDHREGHDLRHFARRAVRRMGPRVADVVAVQEVHGRAGAVATALNDRLRAAGRSDRYRVATRPRMTTAGGACGQVRRSGRHMVLRDTALLVNTATVRRIHAKGALRAWGRWWDRGGCAEQPWVRVTVQRPGEARRTALVLGVHLAPHGREWKNRAMTRMPGFVEQRSGLRDVAVIAGDFNHIRCPVASRRGGRPCTARPGHRALTAAGYVDAARAARRPGPSPEGVRKRIDFIYTDGVVDRAWFDRCYLAFLTTAGCARGVFTDVVHHRACQERHDHHGRPGVECGPRAFRQYYSDHPLLWAQVR